MPQNNSELATLTRACETLHLNPFAHHLQLIPARDLAKQHHPRLDTDRPVLVANVSSRAQARIVQRVLLAAYPPDHRVTLIGQKAKTFALKALGRQQAFAREAVLYVPALQHLSSPLSLAGIVALLRAPDGCPWDREQTHQSLRAALLEETYEVLEALDEQDTAKLCEELGDLMLLVLMQTQIAADAHEFTLTDVGAELAAKLIRRHPHVFGDVKVSGSQEVLANWRRIKAGERRGAGEQGGGGAGEGRVGVPRELPALARAQKVAEKMRVIEKTRGGRANRSGESSFPFQLPREIAAHIEQLERSPIRAERVGQVLFALAAWCEVNGIDAESALRAATSRAVEKIK